MMLTVRDLLICYLYSTFTIGVNMSNYMYMYVHACVHRWCYFITKISKNLSLLTTVLVPCCAGAYTDGMCGCVQEYSLSASVCTRVYMFLFMVAIKCVCVYVCVYVCMREREKERERVCLGCEVFVHVRKQKSCRVWSDLRKVT